MNLNIVDRPSLLLDDSEPPEGWTEVRLNDGMLLDIQSGFAYGNFNHDSGGVPHIRPMNVSVDGKIHLNVIKYVPESAVDRKERRIETGDVIFNNTNSPELVGKTAFYDLKNSVAFSNHMTRVRCNTHVLEPRFLALSLHAMWMDGYFENICNNHVSQASIGRDALSNTLIKLPPVAEQRRIVAKVEALLAIVNSARARLAKVPGILKRFRQSVLASACSGRLTADWRQSHEHKEHSSVMIERIGNLRKERFAKASAQQRVRKYDNIRPNLRTDLDLFDLPEEWEWVDIRFLMNERDSFCYGVVQPGDNKPDGVFLVRAGNLKNGTVDVSELRTIPRHIHEHYPRSVVNGGELLVTVVGANIGVAAIAPNSCKGFNIARAVAKIPIADFNTKYVFHWLSHPIAFAWMAGDAREVARPTLNLEQLQTLPVPLPPIAEQEEIVFRVEKLFKLADAIEKHVAAATARVDKLTQAILAKAFRGELVPTEAELARREGRDYEPASALLEQIRRNTNGSASDNKSTERTGKPRQARRNRILR